jgi:peptidoglycan/LPS O-acetylase OafA/YrhL
MPLRVVGAAALGIIALECAAALGVAWLFYHTFERHTDRLRATIRARLGGGRQPAARRA